MRTVTARLSRLFTWTDNALQFTIGMQHCFPDNSQHVCEGDEPLQKSLAVYHPHSMHMLLHCLIYDLAKIRLLIACNKLSEYSRTWVISNIAFRGSPCGHFLFEFDNIYGQPSLQLRNWASSHICCRECIYKPFSSPLQSQNRNY